MALSIRFSEEKNQLLKATRGIGFVEIRNSIEKKGLLADIAHPSKRYPNQRMYVVNINQYAYAVLYIKSPERNEIFLKTTYPSRVLTRIYLKGGKNA